MEAIHRKPRDYGRFIYAYKHIRTRQVLYSLERELRSRIINKQLPDLGANARPPKIRPDLWKPFFTLIYPESDNGYQRGLDAFRKLREWRMLHEFHDEHPPESYRQRSREEMEELEEKISKRGGSRGESAYDMIKRQNRNMRVRAIMQQQDNSVADLAAVLLEQEKLAMEQAEHRENLSAWTLVPTILPKVDRGTALVKRYERRIAELQEMKRKMPLRWRAGIDGNISPGGIRARLHELRARLSSALSTIPLIEQVREGLREKLIEAREKQAQLSLESNDTTSDANPNEDASAAEEPQNIIPPSLRKLNTNKPDLSIKPMRQKIGPGTRRTCVAKLKQLVKPIESLEGVRIKWQNILDSEVAAEWPESVKHKEMGIADKTAPHPFAPPLMDTIDLQRKHAINVEVNRILAQDTIEEKQAVAETCQLVRLDEAGEPRIIPIEEFSIDDEDELDFDAPSQTTPADRIDAKREADDLEAELLEEDAAGVEDQSAAIEEALGNWQDTVTTKARFGKRHVNDKPRGWERIFRHLQSSGREAPTKVTVTPPPITSGGSEMRP